MTQSQRRACLSALLAGALGGATLFAIVLAKTSAIIAPHYRMTVTAVAQARGEQAALRAASWPARYVADELRRHSLSGRRSIDTRPESQNGVNLNGLYIHEEAATVATSNRALLERIANDLEARARWPVLDLDRRGQFVPVTVGRGVRLWRLRVSSAGAGTRSRAWIQIDGPDAAVSYSDYFMFAFILMLMISFGSLERNRKDTAAFPAGMHPLIIASQILLLSLLLCWTWICYAGGYTGPMFVSIALLAVASLAWWAFKTRTYWTLA